MASASKPVLQGDMPIRATGLVGWEPSLVDRQRPQSPKSDINEESETRPRDVDAISIDSAESIPDFTGRRLITFDDGRINTAYEAWELVLIKDRHTRESWKSFCGINFGTRWVNRNDGCVLTNAIVQFDQGELADMHGDAIRGYKHKRGTIQETAYQQDLANRAYNLPDEAYDKLQLLLEDRTISTNRNPYRHREWRVVVLQPSEFRMTELLPERKRKNMFSQKKQAPVTRTWLVVLRGQETKSTKEDGGWKAYNRGSNPWWRLDKLETKEERNQHKEMAKKMERARVHDRHYSRHRPRPVGPFVPRRLSPLDPR